MVEKKNKTKKLEDLIKINIQIIEEQEIEIKTLKKELEKVRKDYWELRDYRKQYKRIMKAENALSDINNLLEEYYE